jgi:hypothetical protein
MRGIFAELGKITSWTPRDPLTCTITLHIAIPGSARFNRDQLP